MWYIIQLRLYVSESNKTYRRHLTGATGEIRRSRNQRLEPAIYDFRDKTRIYIQVYLYTCIYKYIHTYIYMKKKKYLYRMILFEETCIKPRSNCDCHSQWIKLFIFSFFYFIFFNIIKEGGKKLVMWRANERQVCICIGNIWKNMKMMWNMRERRREEKDSGLHIVHIVCAPFCSLSLHIYVILTLMAHKDIKHIPRIH